MWGGESRRKSEKGESPKNGKKQAQEKKSQL